MGPPAVAPTAAERTLRINASFIFLHTYIIVNDKIIKLRDEQKYDI
jgi:hypothetical protein